LGFECLPVPSCRSLPVPMNVSDTEVSPVP